MVSMVMAITVMMSMVMESTIMMITIMMSTEPKSMPRAKNTRPLSRLWVLRSTHIINSSHLIFKEERVHVTCHSQRIG